MWVFARGVCDQVELLRAAFLILSCVLTLIVSFRALDAAGAAGAAGAACAAWQWAWRQHSHVWVVQKDG